MSDLRRYIDILNEAERSNIEDLTESALATVGLTLLTRYGVQGTTQLVKHIAKQLAAGKAAREIALSMAKSPETKPQSDHSSSEHLQGDHESDGYFAIAEEEDWRLQVASDFGPLLDPIMKIYGISPVDAVEAMNTMGISREDLQNDMQGCINRIEGALEEDPTFFDGDCEPSS